MSDNNQNRRSFNGTGYYIALILCAAAIGISGYLYVRNANKVQEVSLPQTEPQEVMLTQAPETPVFGEEPEPAPEPETAAPAPRETVPERKVLQTGSPVKGTEAAAFSMEALSYNETTRDWRVHNGVDLAAEEGVQVCASADGKVYTTYDDDTLGTTVVIRHDGGYTTRYSSLREDISVKAGDHVTLGQPIGYVGTTALVESALGPHVHFSVSYQDAPMDPAEFLSLQ